MNTAEREPEFNKKNAKELFAFLQGQLPNDIELPRGGTPRLTAKQAWSVIWYLGEMHWQVPDFIERCDICGDLYDSNREGEILDGGKPPYHACDACADHDKVRSKREHTIDY